MQIDLPVLREDKHLPLVHFPTVWQAVIYRNWGMVPVCRIAKVLEADEADVRAAAADLGLDGSLDADPDWLTKGYITIIRTNWHIIPYDALCTLLDWDENRLAFILKEDDFLEVKLGLFKPHTGDCRMRPLTEAEKARTAEIKAAVDEINASLPAVSAKPFDFKPMFARHCAPVPGKDGDRFEERYVYSYCALYGDTFSDRTLLDESFPDELLKAYSANGVTGVWVHIVLYNMVEFPFDPSWSEGWQERQAGMRYLTEKLAKYGLKLFVYFNEPRAMPHSFFEKHPELAGRVGPLSTCLCISLPEVQDYLSEGARQLCANVPLLGGFFTITASENLTTCHSHAAAADCGCPRCVNRSNAETYALVNRLVWEGASSVNPNIKVIAWSWGWKPEYMPDVARLLPREVALMTVSEQGCKKVIGETTTSVLDYSISIVGPGEYARSTWSNAHKYGHPAYAKLQLNNSWESAATPFIPVFDKYYAHLEKLVPRADDTPDGLMLCWTLGGYPSPTLRMLAAFGEYNEKGIPDKEALYASMYPDADAVLLCKAIKQLSDAFDHYPFSIGSAYSGTQLYAPMNLLYAEPTGFSATMVGFPYDSLNSWRSIFPADTYTRALGKMSEGWSRGLALLRSAFSDQEELSPAACELLECTEVLDAHFRSMYLQCRFVQLRDGLDYPDDGLTIKSILAEEQELSLRVAAVQAVNPTIGYESTNHYFYTRASLIEKVLCCRYLEKTMN